jgi:hypothetical protein
MSNYFLFRWLIASIACWEALDERAITAVFRPEKSLRSWNLKEERISNK